MFPFVTIRYLVLTAIGPGYKVSNWTTSLVY